MLILIKGIYLAYSALHNEVQDLYIKAVHVHTDEVDADVQVILITQSVKTLKNIHLFVFGSVGGVVCVVICVIPCEHDNF